ncbi:hypothetical protein [Enterococcus sp. 5H]|uniref:hypothetical protein n=1 Tax=Enterococcus sp. 5H TaxID=1229490 RepID=UPI0023030F65|nr:hypothetical protein [Enterococcus sp. 5H]
MNKKVMSGLIVTLFVGIFGLVMFTEAVEDNVVGHKMGRQRLHHNEIVRDRSSNRELNRRRNRQMSGNNSHLDNRRHACRDDQY